MTINLEDSSPREILQHVSKGAQVTTEIADALARHLNADWVIDLDEAEFLFQMNQAIGSREDESEVWPNFFTDNVARLVLFDLHTPGEIDEDEGNWLADMLDKYGCQNQAEKVLLEKIKKDAQKISGRLAIQ